MRPVVLHTLLGVGPTILSGGSGLVVLLHSRRGRGVCELDVGALGAVGKGETRKGKTKSKDESEALHEYTDVRGHEGRQHALCHNVMQDTGQKMQVVNSGT